MTLKYLAERLYFEFQELPETALGIPAMDLGPLREGPIDLVDRVLFMRKMSGFVSANVSALAVMARQMDEARMQAGTKLWSAGDRAGRVIFCVKGKVACETKDGRRFRYGAGTGIGGIEVLAGRPRWYDAVVEEDVVALLGQPEDLLDLFEHQNRMAMDFLAMLARAQIGIIERKAAAGVDPLAALRDVSRLGGVRVGG
jgi:CRP-like cAMP-binding protein